MYELILIWKNNSGRLSWPRRFILRMNDEGVNRMLYDGIQGALRSCILAPYLCKGL